MDSVQEEIATITDSTITDSITSTDSTTSTTTIQLLPYRTPAPDQYDIMYATKLNEKFKNLSTELQNAFQAFTQNLMDEKQIGRHFLLEAIDDFTKHQNQNQNSIVSPILLSKDYLWVQFNDLAFNYRPYQGCCVM